jgi:hypothetical protein
VLYLLILVLLAAVVALRDRALGEIWWLSHRVVAQGFAVGAAGFALGLVGPILLDPTSGNGPLLWKEWRWRRA